MKGAGFPQSEADSGVLGGTPPSRTAPPVLCLPSSAEAQQAWIAGMVPSVGVSSPWWDSLWRRNLPILSGGHLIPGASAQTQGLTDPLPGAPSLPRHMGSCHSLG